MGGYRYMGLIGRWMEGGGGVITNTIIEGTFCLFYFSKHSIYSVACQVAQISNEMC